MFDGGVPEQLRRFIVSPPPPPPPPPPHSPSQPATAARALPFPVSFPPFETTNHFLNPILLHNSPKIIDHHHPEIKVGDTSGWMSPTDHDYNDHHHHHHHHHPWSNEEVLALIRLRSAMENWFPEFTWDHISRKLTEIGCKRTPQECKEKFEEEERKYFNNNHNNSNDHLNNYNTDSKDNYRMFTELEELYYHDHHHHRHDDDDDDDHVSSEVGCIESEKHAPLEESRSQENDKMGQDLKEGPKEREGGDVVINPNDRGKSGNMKNDGIKSSPTTKLSSSSPPLREMMMVMRNKKKRKKRERFEMLKGFCEGFVRNMIAQQEEMHKKLLEDMMKREEEKIAREEAWQKQEMERINKELEIRAHEHALASDRNVTIIKFINKFTSSSSHDETHHHHHQHQQQQQLGNKVQSPSTSQSSSSLVLPRIPSDKIPTLPIESPSSSAPNKQAPTLSSSQTLNPQNPNSFPTHVKSLEPISAPKPKTQNPKPLKINNERDDIGKRWPRDEVLALINIRCSTTTNNGDDHQVHHDQHHKDGSSSSKALPLWERISKKMLELGYKRSAKRCKEKWENINKYFRKTKHVNKKRPLDSRTCPYFHQLSTLYSQGSFGTATAATVISPAAGEGASDDPTGTQPDKILVGSLKDGSADEPTMHVAEGSDHEKRNIVQDPGFDFEFQLDN